jgi:OmcA/MtrC family decaheme c-type cytochrome
MKRFDGFLRLAQSVLVVCTLAFALGACSGDDGQDGAAGPAGPPGADGLPGPQGPPGPGADAIDMAKAESCGTCHGDVGEVIHQSEYDKYVDLGTLDLTFTNVSSAGAGPYVVTLTYTITENGLPFDDAAGLPSMEQVRFEAVSYDSATGEYLTECRLNENHVALGGGQYTVQDTNCPYAPEQQTVGTAGAHVYGYIARGELLEHAGSVGSELPAGTHVHLYDDVASASAAFGTAVDGAAGAYDSAANVSGCENCHGSPYLKHGYRAAEVTGIPDFAACKSCHFDDRSGGHPDWQYMVDEPFNWATGAPETADYSYTANIMNDVHMSHAMEFPYPQSMSTCNTCHAGKLNQVISDATFTAETCKSCHPVQGLDAWPEELGGQLTTYNQGHRAPPLEYLWTVLNVQGFHNPTLDCATCHMTGGVAPVFADYHTGYDAAIYDASGQKYQDIYTVSIDQITLNGSLLTVNFSSSDPSIVPEVLVSLYGWDSKQFIVASHSSDGSLLCTSRSGAPGGCRMEYTPESSGGGANPLFTEDAASMPGSWMVTLDLAAYVPTAVLPEDIPTLIASGVVKMAEVTITPELDLGGMDVVLKAANETFDLGGSMIVPDYFKGVNATVQTDKCNACHDALASSFHDGSGRGGDGIEVCKNCHVTTSPGSHLEMASRAIDSYVHAIHSFQPFDLGDVVADNDPVEIARTEQHMLHVFPNFTIRNCEACHVTSGADDGAGGTYPTTYNVPDQSKSMPGVLSASDDIPNRNIGTVAETVTGPASRACGGCHRARLINDDLAGELASWNAHTEAFGTYVENATDDPNDPDDVVLYGIIDKIMSMFE